MGFHLIATIAIFTLVISLAYASDPSPLQDFCVATNEPNGTLLVNGRFCKDPKHVEPKDFSFSGLHNPGNTSNPFRSYVTPVNVAQVPGLNTLGISLVRIDYAPKGQNPPHTHPRASEVLFVTKGTLYVGFFTSHPENRLISKILHEGDVFVFPEGLIHFQMNKGTTDAVAFAALSSQNPGVIIVANAHPHFPVEQETVDRLQKIF